MSATDGLMSPDSPERQNAYIASMFGEIIDKQARPFLSNITLVTVAYLLGVPIDDVLKRSTDEDILAFRTEMEKSFYEITFYVKEEGRTIAIESSEVPNTLYGQIIDQSPIGLTYPVIAVHTWLETEDISHPPTVSTPYGIQPTYVMDKTGKIFSFLNMYFLNKLGQGFKLEEVIQISETSELADIKEVIEDIFGKQPGELPKIDVIAKTEDSRYVPLSDQDRALLDEVAQLIFTGRAEPFR